MKSTLTSFIPQFRFLFILIFSTNLSYCQISSPLIFNNNFNKQIGIGLSDDQPSSTASKFSFFPIKTAKDAAEFWSNGNRFTFLNAAALSGSNNSTTASVDVVSDYLGPVRISLVGGVASSKDSVKSNLDRFIANGGTAVLAANYIGPTFVFGKASYILLNINPKFGFDFPGLGSSTNVSTANLDFGVELRANIPLENGDLGLFGHLRQSYVSGGGDFYNQIGFRSSKPFYYTLLNAGITLPKLNVAILFSKALAGPDAIEAYNGKGRISLIVSPRK